jgi:cytochrome c-type biogenesis protein CcmE
MTGKPTEVAPITDGVAKSPRVAPRGVPRSVKILASVLTVGVGLGYLVYATAAPEVEFYKHVDEVTGQLAQWQAKRLQLHGNVVPGSIMRRTTATGYEYQFRLERKGQSIEARYTGTVPDTFKESAEVVVKGRLTPQGYFQVAPGGVMAKCPSKYEATKKQ